VEVKGEDPRKGKNTGGKENSEKGKERKLISFAISWCINLYTVLVYIKRYLSISHCSCMVHLPVMIITVP